MLAGTETIGDVCSVTRIAIAYSEDMSEMSVIRPGHNLVVVGHDMDPNADGRMCQIMVADGRIGWIFTAALSKHSDESSP